MVVGITGGIGSGKSTAVSFFSRFQDVAIYLADDHAKQLMQTSPVIKEQLIATFSSKVYNEKGLNRPFLASIVFADKEKLQTLNSIVHPEVHKHFRDFINQNTSKAYILYENAILFENGSDRYCDKIITVTADKELRVNRVMKRDGVTREQVISRMDHQWLEVKKTLQSHYVITNIKLADTKEQVYRIHQKLLQQRSLL